MKGVVPLWIKFNPNPDGLQTIDCTVRAICAVTGWSWVKAHTVLCDTARDMSDMPSSDRVWWAVLRKLGFVRQTIIDNCPLCYTVSDFARDHPKGTYVLGPPQHAVAIIDGNWWDSWNSGQTVPNYYFRRA